MLICTRLISSVHSCSPVPYSARFEPRLWDSNMAALTRQRVTPHSSNRSRLVASPHKAPPRTSPGVLGVLPSARAVEVSSLDASMPRPRRSPSSVREDYRHGYKYNLEDLETTQHILAFALASGIFDKPGRENAPQYTFVYASLHVQSLASLEETQLRRMLNPASSFGKASC